jgi:tetratricopeptide (TPR) repeat protein
MGRERIRPGKHVYFCVALLILLAGCTGLKNWIEIRDSMRHGEMLLAQGDYDGSVKEYQQALRVAHDRSPADVALFNLGLIYFDSQNPKKDDQKAINSFAELIAAHPQSPWAVQAKIWMAVLDEKARSNEELEKSRQATEKLQQEIDRLKLVIEMSKQEVEKSRQEVEKSKHVLEKSKQVVEKSKQALEKSNQVDIEIEQKKRERGR